MVNIFDAQVVIAQSIWIDLDVVLLGKAAHTVDVGHPGNRPQHGSHDPVLNFTALAQFNLRQGLVLAVCAAVAWVLQGVLVHLAQASRYWAQNGHDPTGHAVRHLYQPLQNQLPRKVHIGFVGKHQSDERHAIAVERPHVDQSRQTRHGNFYGGGNEALHLSRWTAGSFCGNLHLHIGDIRKGIYRQTLNRQQPGNEHDQKHHCQQHPLFERPTDQR